MIGWVLDRAPWRCWQQGHSWLRCLWRGGVR